MKTSNIGAINKLKKINNNNNKLNFKVFLVVRIKPYIIMNTTNNKNTVTTTSLKKEITYEAASILLKNRMANKNFKKEFATLAGARWMLLQEIGRMSNTDTPFTYTVEEAKTIIDTNKESIMPTKSGKYTVNCLISFINKKIKEREKEQKENARKDLQNSRIAKKNTKKLYYNGGLI